VKAQKIWPNEIRKESKDKKDSVEQEIHSEILRYEHMNSPKDIWITLE
jgi:hypothetical protein